MKKFMSILLSTLMLLSCFAVVSFAAITYEQPFNPGTAGSKTFRIPSIITLKDGSVLASADARYDHATDSPGNLDTVVTKSANGYTGWSPVIVNEFADYATGYSDKNSASFIDPAMVQTSTGRIILIVDAFPSGGGSFSNNNYGTGCITVGGKKCLALTSGTNTGDISTFEYYVGAFAGDKATVYTKADNEATAYSVDKEFNLYKDGKALTMKQNGSEATVAQNVFYAASELTVYSTMYLWMRYSDDNGATWSAPELLSSQIKRESEAFLGISPGRGITMTLADGTERIFFSIYDSKSTGTFEHASVIYSDDNGVTWNRIAEAPSYAYTPAIGKTSESQLVVLPGNILRMYSRSKSGYIAYTDSYNYGLTWEDYKTDVNLEGTTNCMVSFINYNSKKIDGKPVILASFAGGDGSTREKGILRVGLVNSDNSVNWVSTYRLNNDFFAYSCLTELADGNIGVLTEEGENGIIKYRVLKLNDDGTLNDVSQNDFPQDVELTFWEKIVNWLTSFWNHILKALGLL